MTGFQSILGHEMIKEHLIRSVSTEQVSHAYILAGEQGMGRKSLADAFVFSLLCENRKIEPCLSCHACKQLVSGNHPDYIKLTHEKTASIGIDDIREQIQNTIMIRPYSSDYKIYLIEDAEKMTVQAQNALLKTIEEPPAYAVILLLTTNIDKFLPTVLSRCVQLKLKPLEDMLVKDYLIDHLDIPKTEAEVYTAFARGNLGKGIKLSRSENFQRMYEDLLYLLKYIKTMSISDLLDYISKLKNDEIQIYDCLDFMRLWYRDVLMFKVTKDINLLIFKQEYSAINEVSKNSGYEGLEKILKAIDKANARLEANVNMELALELMLLDMKEN